VSSSGTVKEGHRGSLKRVSASRLPTLTYLYWLQMYFLMSSSVWDSYQFIPSPLGCCMLCRPTIAYSSMAALAAGSLQAMCRHWRRTCSRLHYFLKQRERVYPGKTRELSKRAKHPRLSLAGLRS